MSNRNRLCNKRQVWFTADSHFDHKRIIEYTNRPFSDVNEMNNELIKRWNGVVKKNDVVYHLGDFMFANKVEQVNEMLSKLNGDVHLVVGNHDKVSERCSGFKSVSRLVTVTVEDVPIVLCHYAMRRWDRGHYGSWQLYGHSHGQLKDAYVHATDVGVDRWDFSPVSFEELSVLFKREVCF